MLYGGFIAEHDFLSTESHGIVSDMDTATFHAINMHMEYGMSSLWPMDYEQLREKGLITAETHSNLATEIESTLVSCAIAAREILNAHFDQFKTLANALLENEEKGHKLTGEEIKELLGYIEGKGLPFQYTDEDGITKQDFLEDPYTYFLYTSQEEETQDVEAEVQIEVDPETGTELSEQPIAVPN